MLKLVVTDVVSMELNPMPDNTKIRKIYDTIVLIEITKFFNIEEEAKEYVFPIPRPYLSYSPKVATNKKIDKAYDLYDVNELRFRATFVIIYSPYDTEEKDIKNVLHM